ncbi:MAG: PaaI family thioesterase [Acidimicrobiia bacterium]|nr:PaaI family thioesterase [Acidimicrobiia bacterium]
MGNEPGDLTRDFDETDLVVPLDRMWSATVGLRLSESTDGLPTAVLEVTEAVCQPLGLVHGGIYACVAEELASTATGRAVMPEGRWCVGQSNVTHFLHAARLGGTLHAVARSIHQGRSTWVWDVECSNESGRLCARSTVTMAVRDGPMPGSR